MQIVCPACGLSSLVPTDQTGGVFYCTGCGKRIRWGETAAPVDEDDIGIDLPSFDRPAATSRSAPPSARTSAKRNKPWLLVLALIIASTVVVILVLVARPTEPSPLPPQPVPAVVSAPVVPWDRAHRSDLVELKSRAEALALSGNLKQSYDSYQQILTTVADHDVTDPVVIEVVAGARAGQDRVMTALMASRSPAAPMVIAAVTRPVAATITPTTVQAVTSTPATRPIIMATTQPLTSPVVVLDPAQAAADNAPPLAGPAPPAPSLQAYTLADAVTDVEIGEAISNGVAFLRGQFSNGEINTAKAAPLQPNRRQPPPPIEMRRSNLDHTSNLEDTPAAPQHPPMPPPPSQLPSADAFTLEGVDALCVYALLHAGQAMDGHVLGAEDPFVDGILQRLKSYSLTFTYHRSLRAAALSVFARAQDNAALEDDLNWLLSASRNGAYTYTMPGDGSGSWDNSNSQYGLLGVWSCAQAGKSVADDYWRSVETHWTQCANGDGTWPYALGSPGTVTMTCAGIASMMVAGDYIHSTPRHGQSPLIDAGLNWLDRGDNCMSSLGSNMGGTGYYLYGLERVGLASGFKYFGKHDWYSELAKRLVAEQHFNGSWGAVPNANGTIPTQTLVDTAYSLLFLARGRHPILYNKLRYDGNWNNRPQDVSHLARFTAHELERPLNWQVVNLRRSGFDWLDCPVLYISGDKAPKLQPADYEALKEFANAGGLIFTHADDGSAAFTRWVTELVRTIFPKYELMQVPRNHDLYSAVYPIKNPPPLLSISNGSRLMLIHSPTDLAEGWQSNWQDEHKTDFQLGVNLFIYVAGKGNLKNRLRSTYIPEDPDKPATLRQIAILQYAGEYDPEPYAFTRFARYFQWETHQAISPVTVPLKSLVPGSVPIAFLTGTVRYDFTPAECAAARAYVQAGGVLMIDACGGQNAFVKSVQNTLLPQGFADASPAPLQPNHPLLLASRKYANDLSRPLLRGYANEHGGKDLPIEAFACGKGWVIFSQLDLTTGLLGTQSWGILGFDPAYAQALMKNAVLWACARSPVK